MSGKLFSIGYSGFGNNADDLINELKKHISERAVVIDVRSSPYSAYYTEFNKDAIERSLKARGIYYKNYVDEFGARQPDRDLYPYGYLDFELFAMTEEFKAGITKVENSLLQGWDVVFMCSEKEPSTCHRAVLITHVLSDFGYHITHILPDGKTKTQTDVDEELIDKLDFIDRSENPEADEMALAYRKQNKEIGFKVENL